MKKLFIIILILSTLVINSCSVSKPTSDPYAELKAQMESYIDKSKHTLLLDWGSPASVNSDGNGGEIIVFEQLKRIYTETFGYYTVVHKVTFYINSQNIVYQARYDRSDRQGF
jgi:hypothetical protein